jgi:hypothetical protein
VPAALSLGGGEREGRSRWQSFRVGLRNNQGFSESREVLRRDYSSNGVFTSWAIAGPNLVKSRTFQVNKVSAPAFRAQ